MKSKGIFISGILFMLFLSGCGKSTDMQQGNAVNIQNIVNTEGKSTRAADSAQGFESYVGKYYSEDCSADTIYTEGGSCIDIKSVSGNNVKFIITAIGSAPNNRIATVEAEGSVGENGIVNFSYSNDGWGNSGVGVIVLKDGKVVVTSHIEKADSRAMWNLPVYDNKILIKQ